jgi:hypothetical protein
MYQQSADLADEARRLSLGRPEPGGEAAEGELIGIGIYEELDPTSSDEELFALASAEASAVKAVHNQAISIALNRLGESTQRAEDPRSKESAVKWASLLESLRIR